MDGISARIWKESAEELSYPLALLFNVSLNSGRVSSSWKRANVTPVFKAGATDLVENYRSISLLSISTKCQEKIVTSFLTDWQQGFVKSRSCATYQVVLPHHQWTRALEDGLQVDVVFLDFAKAFVKVLHVILLQKLCNFGISEFLLKWCEDYLTERELWVVKRVGVPPGLSFLLLYPRVRY